MARTVEVDLRLPPDALSHSTRTARVEEMDGMTMTLRHEPGAYALGPDDGEALWFNGATGLLKATADQTEGRYAAYELRIPRGFGPPLHAHANEDEFFVVLSGEVRLRHGDTVVEGVPGSFAYTPRGVAHSFVADSDEARLLLFFGPAGVEEFFRQAGTPARWVGPPPADTPVKDRETLLAIMNLHGQTVLGPPLGPKDVPAQT